LVAETVGAPGMFRRALVVDDEGGLQLLVRLILEQTDYLVDVAQDGLQASAQIDKTEYEAIICDINMPNMDGPALYDHLAISHPQEARRVLFVTGGELDREVESLIERSGCRLLRKPFSVSELHAAVMALSDSPCPA
jgi:DNA-binding response OmpR family regulator